MDNKKRDKYLIKKYGITLNEYNRILADQGGVCAICCKSGITRALAVDHDHQVRYMKIRTWKDGAIWNADADYRGLRYLGTALTKPGAIQALRHCLLKSSVRGILCFKCNSGLIKYGDDPVRLLRASEYLKKFYNPATISIVPASNLPKEN